MNREIKIQIFLKSWVKIAKREYALWCCFNHKKLNLFFFLWLAEIFFHTVRQFCDSLGQTWHLSATRRKTALLFLLFFSTPSAPLCTSTRNEVACLSGWNLFGFFSWLISQHMLVPTQRRNSYSLCGLKVNLWL